MRNKLYILPALLFALIFTTCKNVTPPGPNDFYYQCKINGQRYVPNSCANCLTCTIYQDTIFLLGANAGFETVGIGIINISGQPISATTYILNNNPRSGADYKNSTAPIDIFNTDTNHIGQLEIITLDTTNKIIKGTFYFKAYNSYKNDSVSVTDGDFRLKYTTN